MLDRLFAAAPSADTDQDLVPFRPAAQGIGLDLPKWRGNARLFLSEPCIEGPEKIMKQHGNSDERLQGSAEVAGDRFAFACVLTALTLHNTNYTNIWLVCNQANPFFWPWY
ncbi:MAG: hypothetical protein ABTS16_03995 [Candidatus Accumulibacter phosphatis]|uniref:Uncharacterized protein n=1 Tax=Candidatus Accumulibacter contiguus TaxID=2954381 RepID=A0ABX1TAC1_9PROT|nr:hypothetical protein [Candidatus Accumulibacter contiguus]